MWRVFRGGLRHMRLLSDALGVGQAFRDGLRKRWGKEAAVLFAVTFHGLCFSSKDGC